MINDYNNIAVIYIFKIISIIIIRLKINMIIPKLYLKSLRSIFHEISVNFWNQICLKYNFHKYCRILRNSKKYSSKVSTRCVFLPEILYSFVGTQTLSLLEKVFL